MRKSKIALILLIVACTLVPLGVFGGTATAGETATAQKDEFLLGFVAHEVRNTWEDFYTKAFNWYCRDISEQREDLKIKTTWTEAGQNTSMQITQARRLIDMGIDGLIISPWGVDALRNVMNYAKQNGVPVICTNTVVNSGYPLMFVGYSGRRSGGQLANRIIEYLKTEVEPVGQIAGTVLEVSAGPGTPTKESRGAGFHEVIDKYENVEVITKNGKSARGVSKTVTLNSLRSGTEFDAVYAQAGQMVLGAVGAFKSYSSANPKNVYFATVDAFPDVLKEIEKGNINVALDQPPGFYNPIAVHYMIKYLRRGEGALPDYGDTVTTEELKIRTGTKHRGVDPWAEPVWAPAKIKHMTEYGDEISPKNDHRWFQTNAVIVTKENYDSPILWGNFPLPGW